MCALPAQSRVNTSLMEGGAVEAFANLHAQLCACERGGGQARYGGKVQEGRSARCE